MSTAGHQATGSVTARQHEVLTILSHHPAIFVGELASTLGVSSAAVTKVVTRQEVSLWVIRIFDDAFSGEEQLVFPLGGGGIVQSRNCSMNRTYYVHSLFFLTTENGSEQMGVLECRLGQRFPMPGEPVGVG